MVIMKCLMQLQSLESRPDFIPSEVCSPLHLVCMQLKGVYVVVKPQTNTDRKQRCL